MTRSNTDQYTPLPKEEATIADAAAWRRTAAMFNQAQHPHWRTAKGVRKGTPGAIHGVGKTLTSLVNHAMRAVHSGDGLPKNVVHKRAVLTRVYRQKLEDGLLWYEAGAWWMHEDTMLMLCAENCARRRQSRRERTNNGYATSAGRRPRAVPAAA